MDNKTRILVIDADDMILRLVSRQVKALDPSIEVLTAETVTEASRQVLIHRESIKVIGISSMMRTGDTTVPNEAKDFLLKEVPRGTRLVGASTFQVGMLGLRNAGCHLVLDQKNTWAQELIAQLHQPTTR